MTLKKFIKIKIQVEGIHQWKECNIKEVLYLKNPHRHIFHITVIKEINHNNRDIEIIQFKHKVLKSLGAQPINFGNKSCEDIAEKIIKEFDAYSVEVLEDNENGAIIINK